MNEPTKIACRVCHMEFFREADLDAHCAKEHPRQQYVQTIFTPDELKVLYVLCLLGAGHDSLKRSHKDFSILDVMRTVKAAEAVVIGEKLFDEMPIDVCCSACDKLVKVVSL